MVVVRDRQTITFIGIYFIKIIMLIMKGRGEVLSYGDM